MNIWKVTFWVGLALFVSAFVIDFTDGGLNDCADNPKYCENFGELVDQYPQFLVPENLIHQYVDGALEHH